MNAIRVLPGLVVGLALVTYGSSAALAQHEPALAGADVHDARAVAEVEAQTFENTEGKTPEDAGSSEHTEGAHAGGHGGGNSNPLEFKTDLALWTGVVFVVVLLVLRRFAWGPIAQGLARREKGIADQITDAQDAHRQAQELLAKYQQQLADAKDEVRAMIDQARRDAEQTGREMLDQSKAEVEAEHQRALRRIEAATAGALKELAEEGASLAVQLAGKIVQAELKPKDHEALIQRTMASFSRPGRAPSEN